MTDRQSAEHGYAQHAQVLGQHVRHRHRPPVGAIGELTDRNAGHPGQGARPAQVQQHSVHFVRWLVHLLEQQNRSPQVRHVRRADGGREQAQVAAQQHPAGRGSGDPYR